MNYLQRRRRYIAAAALTGTGMLASAASVQAQATQITSASALAASASTVSFVGDSSTALTSYTGMAGGNTLTFTADNGTLLLQNQDDFNGAFASGTTLLETKLPNGGPSGTLTLVFASGVQQFGLSAQDIDLDTQTFTFVLASGAQPLGVFTVGPLDNSSGAGQLAFLGAMAPAGLPITSVSISSASASTATGDTGSNLFAIGPVSFTAPAAAPEPSGLALLGIGGLTLGACFLAARFRISANLKGLR